MTEQVGFPRAWPRPGGLARVFVLTGLLVGMSAPVPAGAFPPQATTQVRQAAIAKSNRRLAVEPMDFGTRVELARLLAQERDFAAALENYEFVLRHRPENLAARIGRAQVLGWTGRHREALAEVEKVLAANPRNFEARIVKAYNLLWLGELSQAKSLFEQLARENPRHSDAREGLLEVEKAERAAADAPPPAPARTPALEAAERAEAEGNYAEAVRQYRQHLAQSPRDSDAEFRLARVLGWNRDYAESEKVLRDYAQRFPSNPEAFFQLARVLSWQEKYPEAVDYYRKGLALRPEADAQRVELARVLAYTGEHARALDEYRVALQMRPDNREAQVGVVEALIQTGEIGTARREINRLSQQYPGDRQIEALKQDLESATLRRARDQATGPEAEARLRALVNENPESVEARMALAEVLLARNDFPGALQEFRAVRQLRPDDEALQLQLARVLSWNQQFAESVKLYQEYLVRNPQDLPVRQEMARVMSWWRDYNASVAEYRRILAENPDDTQTRLEMARVLSWSREYGPALEEFEDLIRRDPKNFDAWLGKGRVHTYRQQWKDARRALDTALEIKPGDREATTARAQVELWSGNPDGAQKMLSELHAADPSDTTVLLSMASAENSLGRPDRALNLLEEAERIEPRNTDVRALREAIQRGMRPELRFGWSYVRDTEGLNIWRYQLLDFRFNLHPRLRNFITVDVLPSSALAEIFGYRVFQNGESFFSPRVPVEPFVPAPTALGFDDFPPDVLVSGGDRIAQNALQFQFGGTAQISSAFSLTASGGLIQLRHGARDFSGLPATHERAIWSVSPTFKLGRHVQINLGTARRYFPYTPKSVAQTMHADEYTGDLILSPDSRTRIAFGYYHRALSPEFLLPDIPLPDGGTFAGRVFRRKGNGGTLSATRILWRGEKAEFEAGYDAMLFGYTSPEGLPSPEFFLNTGFFTPSFYQRHAGLARVTLKPSRYIVWDLHGTAGPQQIRQRSDFSFSSTAGSRLDFVFTPDFVLSVGYDYFNTASALQALIVPGRAAAYHSNNVYATLLIRF